MPWKGQKMSLQKATNNCDTLSLRKALFFQLKSWQKTEGHFHLCGKRKLSVGVCMGGAS